MSFLDMIGTKEPIADRKLYRWFKILQHNTDLSENVGPSLWKCFLPCKLQYEFNFLCRPRLCISQLKTSIFFGGNAREQRSCNPNIQVDFWEAARARSPMQYSRSAHAFMNFTTFAPPIWVCPLNIFDISRLSSFVFVVYIHIDMQYG